MILYDKSRIQVLYCAIIDQNNTTKYAHHPTGYNPPCLAFERLLFI